MLTLATEVSGSSTENVSVSESGSEKTPDTSKRFDGPPTLRFTSAKLSMISGARLVTVTLMDCVAEALSMSSAFTVIVVLPVLPDVIVTVSLDTLAVATAVSSDEALYESVSPSGSVNLPETITSSECRFLNRLTPLIEPCRRGALLRTVTVRVSDTEPLCASVAVTATVASPPSSSDSMVTVLPDTLTSAISVSEDPAEKVIVSPSGSEKWLDALMLVELFLLSVLSDIARETLGGLFSTATLKLCVLLAFSVSSAVTVIRVEPSIPGSTDIELPETLTVVTDVSPDEAV